MTQRIRHLGALFTDRPFSGAGVSLYAQIGTSIRYRNLRLLPGGVSRRRRRGWIKGTGGVHDVANAVQKTARVASAADPNTEIAWPIPVSMASQTVTLDVRRFDSDVQNLTDNFRTRTVVLDANRDEDVKILGTGQILSQEKRAGGIVRLRLLYLESRDGIQPDTIRALRTAGPTSPADATAAYTVGQQFVEIDTPQLDDSSAYTYTIRAEANAGAVTKDLITGLSVQADASGPPAPVLGSAQPW